jgi:hypothetical protein
MPVPIKLSGKKLSLHKAIVNPKFINKTVLVDNPWDYIEMWLKRNDVNNDAIFYWQQAKQFYYAASELPLTSSPLTQYYCMLNATKTLLLVKEIQFSDYHGVTGYASRNRVSLSNEIVKIQMGGVLPALCSYLGEKVKNIEEYTLKNIFYNLPFIHRAYTLTYTSEQNKELFIPIKSPIFIKKDSSSESWFSFELEESYANQHTINKLPSYYERDIGRENAFVIRNKRRFRWKRTDQHRLSKLVKYHRKIRKDLYYISGLTRLWYIKRTGVNNIISRHTMPLMFAGMHRLSELSRYDPITLSKHLTSQQNWLLSEFIKKATDQFVDEISSEITGEEFMTPGFTAKLRN